MQLVKPAMKKPNHMQLAKPAILPSSSKKKKSVYDDKNCQSAKCAHMQKTAMPQSNYKMGSSKKYQVNSEGTQFSYLQSMSKTACKQIGTQPEVTRNKIHTVLPTQLNHSDSRSSRMHSPQLRSVNPGKMQSNHMWPVKADLKKSQVNTRSQVETSKYKRDRLRPKFDL